MVQNRQELVQKNFRLPIDLVKAWNKFQGVGSQEGSKNAAGEFFLFMLMPDHVRSICRDLAYQKPTRDLRRCGRSSRTS